MQLDEDDVVLVASGLADPETRARIGRIRRSDARVDADLAEIETLDYLSDGSAGRPVGRARWFVPLAALAAASTIVVLPQIGSEPPPPVLSGEGHTSAAHDQSAPDARLIAKGRDGRTTEYALALGDDMRVCGTATTCRWKVADESLVVHYQGPAMPVRVSIRDALGDLTQLYPDPRFSAAMPHDARCRPGAWCVVDGGDFSVPLGAATLCVQPMLHPPMPAQPPKTHCFALEIHDDPL